MEHININKYKQLNYFIWDGKNDTISDIENYIKEMNYKDYLIKRAMNDNTILCVVKKYDDGSETTMYCYVNQCIVDVFNKDSDTLIVLDEENVNQEFLSKW